MFVPEDGRVVAFTQSDGYGSAASESAGEAVDGTGEAPEESTDVPDQDPSIVVASLASRQRMAAIVMKAEQKVVELQRQRRECLARPPEVAILVRGVGDAVPPRPANVEPKCIMAEAEVEYLGAKSRLLVLRSGECCAPSSQIVKLTGVALPNLTPGLRSDRVWPLHSWEKSELVMAMHLLLHELPMTKKESGRWLELLERLMRRLAIWIPRDGGPYLDFLRRTYGHNAAAAFSCKYFHAQMLWAMALICAVFLVLEATLDSKTKDAQRRALELCTVFWGACTALLGWRRFVRPLRGKTEEGPEGGADERVWRLRVASAPTPRCRMFKLIFLAFPALVLFCCFVMLSFVAIMQLIFYVVFAWGDCLNLTNEHIVCRDAQTKHGFWGWLAEVLCDILLVLMFEIYLPCSELLATWIADLQCYEFVVDRKYFIWSLQAALASFESLAFRACYALIFTPQWTDPATEIDHDYIGCKIFDTWCKVQKSLDVEDRRYIYERLTKGPFVVAPFIAIVMKVITPLVASILNKCAHRVRTTSGALSPLRGIARLLALIFAYDGGHVGCFRYVFKGRPWGDVHVMFPEVGERQQLAEQLPAAQQTLPPPPFNGAAPVTKASAWGLKEAQVVPDAGSAGEAYRCHEAAGPSALEKLEDAMRQFLQKRFEPHVEILEVNIHFIGVLFFGPLMPGAVMALLVAKVLEIEFGMVKMLYVRRRIYPGPDEALRRSQVGFMTAAVFCAAGWHAGLNLTAYNDDLYKWGDWRSVTLGMLFGWIFVATSLLLLYNQVHRSDPKKLEAALAEKTSNCVDSGAAWAHSC